ncbi:DUF4280 domain-containing protein [Acidisoma sp. C75]
MPAVLTIGSMITCNQSMVPVPIPLLGVPTTATTDGMPVATIAMMVPFENIETFGVCVSEANPEVVAAKLVGSPGVPCVPIIDTPWDPPSPNILIDGIPAALASSKCLCTWLGEISVEIDEGISFTDG